MNKRIEELMKVTNKREQLLAWVEETIPFAARGMITREFEVDFPDSAKERGASYEKIRVHTYKGGCHAFLLEGDTSYEALRNAGRVRLF